MGSPAGVLRRETDLPVVKPLPINHRQGVGESHHINHHPEEFHLIEDHHPEEFHHIEDHHPEEFPHMEDHHPEEFHLIITYLQEITEDQCHLQENEELHPISLHPEVAEDHQVDVRTAEIRRVEVKGAEEEMMMMKRWRRLMVPMA